MPTSNFDVRRFPPSRDIVVDAGYLAAGRHVIHGLVEVDVTHWFKKLQGTVVLTSVGMFGRGGGWGLGFLPTHTLGLTVGGIAQKPGLHEGQVAVREYLHLTVSFDHDIVDGAPAARFARALVDLIEAATLLEEPLHQNERIEVSGPSDEGRAPGSGSG